MPPAAEKQAMASPPPPPADVYPWATSEKYLNYHVGAVALLERLGNGLGTLAFTWATVVVLGGFSTDLGKDFWYATAIVFLEAFRVFSRESRSDDELLFRTTGSIKLKRMKLVSRGIPYYLTVFIVIVCMYGTLQFVLRHYGYNPPHHYRLQYHILVLAVLLALASVAQAPMATGYLQDHAWLQFVSAFVAVLALGSAMLWSHAPKRELVLIIPPLLVGCLQCVFKELATCLEGLGCNLGMLTQFSWLGALASLILPAWIVISVLVEFGTMGVLILLGTLLLGNIQIPVAVARIVISAVRLSSEDGGRSGNVHLAPALTIFYSMVLAQGVLYVAACVLETLLSSHVRRALARSCKLAYPSGYEAISRYYEHAYNKRMQEGVLAQEDIMNLLTFAFHSLDSSSTEKKCAAVQILHSLLYLEKPVATHARLVSEITVSTKVVASLINMLGWTLLASGDDEKKGINTIKWFTANVIASLAGDLRIVGIPSTMQMISSLLDVDANIKAKQDISNQRPDKTEMNTKDNQQQNDASSTVVDIQDKKGLSEQDGGKKTQSSRNKLKFLGFFRFSNPEDEEPTRDMSLLPIIGMEILEKLANDLDNCAEIIEATGLIPRMIGFIINTTNTTNNIMTSSLKLIAKLMNIEGEMSTIARQKILGEPFILCNLVEILVDTNDSHTEQWEATMVIMAKIILQDKITSKDVERFQVIIPKLIHAFLVPKKLSNAEYDPDLRKLAGEALSKLVAVAEKPTMEKKHSIVTDILQEKGYGLLGDLKKMLQRDEYTFEAAVLLRNLCGHVQYNQHQRLSEQLSSILHLVLEKILNFEGKQLQALIATASELCNLIPPKKFAFELESYTQKEKIVQKLVDALNSNKKMCHEFPNMRGVVVEITISIMVSCPHYSPIFKDNGMMEALSMVERILAKVEKYRNFLGNATTELDTGLPTGDQVAKAKNLLLGSEIASSEVDDEPMSLEIVHVTN